MKGHIAPVFHHDFVDGLERWQLHDPLAQLARWLDRDALMLGGGRPVLAPVACEPPYSVLGTLSGGTAECYIGFCFHVADVENFETIYLAPHTGGYPEAIQYDPVIRGSNTWQIFGDADGLASANLQRQRWHVFRLDVWPDIAQIYVDDEGAPLATFPLRSGRRSGEIGLWGYLPSYVADLTVRPLEAPAPPVPTPKAVPPAGTIRQWLVARYDPDAKASVDLRTAASEHNGTLCFNRLYRVEPEARAYAAFEVETLFEQGQQVSLEVGYSDRARIWFDGILLHEGEWRWNPVAGTDGRIRPGHVTIPVPCKVGRHLVLTEITALEPGFGWGITARVTVDGVPCDARPASHLEVPSAAL